jgi:hypothetical protein
MTIDEILLEQYLLGREHEAMFQRGEKREVGGEIAVAKKQIQKLLNEEHRKAYKEAVINLIAAENEARKIISTHDLVVTRAVSRHTSL